MKYDDLMAYFIRMDFQAEERLDFVRGEFYRRSDRWSAAEALCAVEHAQTVRKMVHDICAILAMDKS